jgi:uncharacterized protein YyaL (SSP411 family)
MSLHTGQHINNLVFENSPYLLQHSHDLINWRAWNDVSLNEAKLQNKPIFLSIGFSTCHWCHVMRREVFNNPEIAALINKYFIPIKIDKEQMPDIDTYYMQLYEIMEERKGGWPLTFILTENLEPIFAGTYVPPYSTKKMEGLDKIIPEVMDEYINDRQDVIYFAEIYKKQIGVNKKYYTHKIDFPIDTVMSKLKNVYDEKYAGFKHIKIKFPEADILNLLINIYLLKTNDEALEMTKKTLNILYKSGLYDQIEGAFFRYSTDKKFKIPHFEKMLYTNALLISLYSRAYNLGFNNYYSQIVTDTIKEINRIYRTKNHLYYSASDAESIIDGKKYEGGYFIYSYDDTKKEFLYAGFNESHTEKFLNMLDITKKGNFENGYSVVNIKKLDKNIENYQKEIEVLKNIRKKRKFPFIDKKIITSWNALMITALLNAETIDETFKDDGIITLNAILKTHVVGNRVFHSSINNKIQKKSLLEDYAYLIEALIKAYEITFNKAYIEKAYSLSKYSVDTFYKDGFWFTDSKKNILADLSDRYMTSPVSVMIKNLLKLSLIESDNKLYNVAQESMKSFYHKVIKKPYLYPSFVSNLLEYKVGGVLIKSNEENLYKVKKDILEIKRPFVYIKVIDSDKYLACTNTICFAVSDKFDDIKNKVITLK